MELKVTSKKGVSFYLRAAATFLRGTETKEAVSTIRISGLGIAINVAISVATRVENLGLGRITKIATDYITENNLNTCRVVIDIEKIRVNIDDLAPEIASELENCKDSLAHVMYVQSRDTTDNVAAKELDKLISGSWHSRVGVIGSIKYEFPGIAYKDSGVEAVEQMMETAAEALLGKARPSAIVNGGSYSGPQGTLGQACERHSVEIVHVIPNIKGGAKDLRGILWDGDTPRIRKNRWRLAFVGTGWTSRNCILASLNGHYMVCAGGPGTHTELTELRCNGAALLPLVRSGGLCEGVAFGEKNAQGMPQALMNSAPSGVEQKPWEIMLGAHDVSVKDYCHAVEQVFSTYPLRSKLDAHNRWPMNAAETEAWEESKRGEALAKATS